MKGLFSTNVPLHLQAFVAGTKSELHDPFPSLEFCLFFLFFPCDLVAARCRSLWKVSEGVQTLDLDLAHVARYNTLGGRLPLPFQGRVAKI